MENLLISACLLGESCRYDGEEKGLSAETLAALMQRYHLVPVCPEIMGGLPTPRQPAEIVGDEVVTKDGRPVTAEYLRGGAEALRMARLFGCRAALLKERSPSCGSGKIYDGTFSGKLVSGFGKTAALLSENGLRVFGESEIDKLLSPEK